MEEAPPEESRPGERTPELVEHFFRHEAGRLHGVLTRMLGPQNLSLVEDVTQEALLRALKTWSIGGHPPNPSAWITKVAKNLALDALRHRRMAGGKEDALITHFEQVLPEARPSPEPDPEEDIRDDTLRLMFVCCHPVVKPDAQVILALKVLCGFSPAEIAHAFFSSEAAIAKQLTRTKQRIREAGVGFELPEKGELSERVDRVLATLYLLFNEGYKATSGEHLMREELCREAIRLTTLLVEHPAGRTPPAHALLALMLLCAARFPARLDDEGVLLPLQAQDRTKWDDELIKRGLRHLAESAQGEEVSEYHLESGIAACHCTAPDYASTDWERIRHLYDILASIKPSPVIALNRAVAIAHVEGEQSALDALEGMPDRARLESHHLLHAVRGELFHRLGRHATAAGCFRQALQLCEVGPEQRHLKRMLDRSARLGSSAGTN